VPNPRKGESKEGFVSRCMGDAEARSSFPDQKQRAAFCYSQYARKSHSMRDLLAIQAQSSGTYRIERLSGADYVVVPVIALVEGVIQGITAEEPELALASEFGRFATAWNGRPVTIDHPFLRTADDEIIRVSASTTPDVLEDFQVGFIFNTKVDSTSRLAMEVWLDPQKMNSHSDAARELLAKVKKGEKIEVSTGLFTDTETSPGEHNGKKYNNVWRHVVPDHLALLPGDLVGACSIADGCGVYANAKSLRDITTSDLAPELRFRVHQLVKACDCEDCSGEQASLNAKGDKAPYGDVAYADPGYQSDGKKRYLVDTPEHIRAAWNYINQQRNADKYTPARLAKVKGQIVAAWKSKIDKKGPPEARTNSAAWKREVEDHLAKSSTVISFGGGLVVNASVPDDMLHTDAHSQIQKGLDREYQGEYPSLVSHTNHDAVFSKYDSSTGGSRKIYSRGYHVDPETKNASFEDDQEREVNLTTSITPTESVQEAAGEDSVRTNASNPNATSTVKEETQMTDKTKTAPGGSSAAATTPTVTAEDARKFLANIVADPEKLKDTKEWPDERVLKLHAKVQAKMKSAADDEDEDDDPKDKAKNNGGKKDDPKTYAAPPTAEEYLAAAPAGVREALESGMRMHQAHKDALITKLTSTNRCKFSADQLKAMDVPMLENLVELAAVPDYGGRAPAGSGDLRAQAIQAEKDGDAPYAAPPPRLNLVKKDEAATTTKAA
jgi:Uncharacterized protein conserved in bacteria (DUF2213)